MNLANLQERRNKDGRLVSFSIRVFRGRDADGKQLKPWTATFTVEPGWSEKTARKKAEAFAATFEKECREGLASDSRQTFRAYAEYTIGLKEARGVKHSTIVRYRELTERIYPVLGHVKIRELRTDLLNDFHTNLGQPGVKKGGASATSKEDLSGFLKSRKISQAALAKQAGISASTVSAAVKGVRIAKEKAVAIAAALQAKPEDLFEIVEDDGGRLSPKTILEYHRFISTVLEQAVREGLILFNPASRATLPKVQKKDPNYFQPEEVVAIREALESEPLRWKVMTHLFLLSGARRGELLGLKWAQVDFENSRIRIVNNILYSPDRGIYEDTPKTETSVRYIALPAETMKLLNKWRLEQAEERMKLGQYYDNRNYVFAQNNGAPMHPDSVTQWMNEFSKRHGLPHINPHAFRHTMASLLYYNGVDSISISKRLGHAQVSTTANIYAHVIESADQHNVDVLEKIYLKNA